MRTIERVGLNFPRVARAAEILIQKVRRSEAAPTLNKYTYTQIELICDQTLASDKTIEVRARNRRARSTLDKLNQYSPYSVVGAAVLIGLARAGNIEKEDVDILKNITYTLLAIDDQHNLPFCAAIRRSMQTSTIMAKSSRPDYASIEQLAVIAEDSYNALVEQKEKQGKFEAYTTLEGKRIASRKKFVLCLSGSGETIASASIRIAVGLGVLATQPEKVSLEEKEWLRQNVHYVKLPGSRRLKAALENFHGLLGIM